MTLPKSRKRPAETQIASIMKRIMAESLAPEKLGEMLESKETPTEEIIIIDCRPLLAVNTGTISGANEVHCPPIVKRRSGGNIPIDNILRDAETRERVAQSRYSYIVIYDEDCASLDGLPQDSNMFLVIKTLFEETNGKNIYFLNGGFERFQKICPHLCTHTNKMSDMTNPLVLPSLNGHANGFCLLPSIREQPKRNSLSDDTGPAEVLPWLYIGNLKHAMEADHLLKIGMSALINMAASTESSPLPSPHFIYKNIPVRDSVSADILQWFPEVIRFIESIRKRNGKVLVHCKAGISRSATMCIAYLMYHKNMALEQAFDYLRSKRNVINPNLSFMRQLMEFETHLREKGSLRLEASPNLPFNILSENHMYSPSKSALSLPIMQQSPFAFDMTYDTTATTATSPIMSLHSPLMSPS